MKTTKQNNVRNHARLHDPRKFKAGRNRTRLRSLALDVTRAVADGAPIEMLMFSLGPKIVMELIDRNDDQLLGLIKSAANSDQARVFRSLVYGQAGRALDGGILAENVTAIVLFGIPLTLQSLGKIPRQLDLDATIADEAVQRALTGGHLIGKEAFLLPGLYRHEDLEALTPCAVQSLAELWASVPPDTPKATKDLPIVKPAAFDPVSDAQLRYLIGVLRGAPKKPPHIDIDSTQDRCVDLTIERFSNAMGARVVTGPVREFVAALKDGISMLRAARLSDFLISNYASAFPHPKAVLGTKKGIADALFVRLRNGREVALPLRPTDDFAETLDSVEHLLLGHGYAFDISTSQFA